MVVELKGPDLEEEQVMGYSQSANRTVEVGQTRRLSAEVIFITSEEMLRQPSKRGASFLCSAAQGA